MKESRKPHERVETEIAVLREIASAVARERNVRRLLEDALGILERSMGMLRGTFTLLEGDELRIVASTSGLNAEERALGRYRLGEGITGLVAKTGKAEVVCDVRKDRRFLNRTKSRRSNEALSFVCVPLVHRGQIIGTLSADRAMTGETTALARDVELLEIIANLVAEAAFVCREEDAEREALVKENRVLRDMVKENPGRIIGNCPEMRAVYEQIRVESELFGHEKGAFTDARERRIGRAEAADGGTLFLDEIGDLTIPVQVKLLRFLQERTFSRVGSNETLRSDVRFIAATSRNLEELMAKKLFREDLYYRLSVFPISLPRLADRADDVILLAQSFLARMRIKYEKNVTQFSIPALNALKAYSWPGNVRELENCVERAVLTARDEVVRTYNLPEAVQKDEFAEDPFGGGSSLTLDEQISAFERRILDDALARHGGNHAEAAKELGLSPRMMSYRLARSGSSAYRGTKK